MTDINFNVAPYLDDFDDTKNYHRILFKPTLAVQTRELNQLQSAIQNQIKRFGQHVFVEGSTVLNSERFFDNNLLSIAHTGSIFTQGLMGKVITGATSAAKGVIKAYDLTTKRIIFSQISGDNFVAGENLTYLNDIGITITIQTDNTFDINSAMLFSVNTGIIFVKGNFVYNEKQQVILNPLSNSTSHSVGFKVVQEIVSADEDTSLLDNSQGSPNFAAPGADRYFIDLQLISTTLVNTLEDYIEIARIENGELVFVQQRTLYNELEKEFARRTYDESGNYTVKPFSLSFEPHITRTKLKPIVTAGSITQYTIVEVGEKYTATPTITVVGNGTGATAVAVIDNNAASPTFQKLIAVNVTNGGSGYTQAETYVKVSGDPNKFTAKLEPGKAYVKGFEFETQAPSYITMNKARTTEFVDNSDVSMFYGNYLFVNAMFGFFNTSSFQTVELHNVVRGSVVNTSQIGTAKVRFLDYLSGTVGNAAAIYKLYLYDIILSSSTIANVESIVVRSAGSTTPGANVTVGANIDNLSKLNGNTASDVFLTGSDLTSLVFPLNHIYIQSLRDTLGNAQNDYTFKRTFSNVAVSANQISISTSNGLERFVAAPTLSLINSHYHFVVVTAGGGFLVGDVISPTSATLGPNIPGSTQTITFNFATTGQVVNVQASINGNAQTEKTKSLQPYTFKIISAPNTISGAVDSIGIADLYKVAGIYNTGNVNPTGLISVDSLGVVNWGSVATPPEVSQNYIVDNGQRDDIYDHASIILNGTAPLTTNYIVVVYNYFTHTNSGFASVDSYSIPYEEIPLYTSSSTGVTISLADVIDFRPRRVDNSAAVANAQLPDPDVQFQTDYKYYVGRIDRITANASKSFSIKEGIPSTSPSVPTEVEDGMTLYVVEVPPFTETLESLTVKYVENKRYTMRDIGRIEKRVENLEYYTQLSLLEKQAKDESVVDATNFEKFKNGFFVDSFSTNNSLDNTEDTSAWSKQIWGWWNNRENSTNTWNKGVSRTYSTSTADSLNFDYHCAMDPLRSELRAEAFTSYGNFTFNTGTNTRKTGDLVSLNYTEKEFISNPLASKRVNINPFDVIAFNGSITLNPSSDQWVETSSLPAVNKIVDVQLPDLAARTDTTITGNSARGRARTAITSVTTRTVTNVVGQQTSSLGSSVVDVQYIPFARARTILAVGSKFKPKARVYPFFETSNFSAFTKPLTLVETSNNVGGLFSGLTQETVQFRTGSTTGPIVATAQVAIYSPPKTSDPTRRLLSVFNVTGVIPSTGFVVAGAKSATLNSVVSYALGASLVPDEHGLLGVEVNIPKDTLRTGARQFRLIDNIDNQQQGSQSAGEASYFAQGILQSKQETILTTRSVQSQQVTTVTGYYYDPLAQTFNVDGRFNPSGVHVSSVDIYFSSKSNSIPVSLEITKTINGFPESIITSIPFAIVIKNPEDVNISADGSVATRFTLPSLVHLVPGEYAIALKANTQDYEVYCSEMGRTDLITNQIINKQPALGVLFKSQNGSTWTAFQEEDMKFKLNIAEFATSGSSEFLVNNIADFRFSYMNLRTSNVLPTGTNIQFSYKALNPGTPSDIMDTSFIPLNSNVDIELGQVKKVLGIGSYIVKADMTTDNTSVSPVIDVEGLGVILVNNNINMTDITVTDGEEVALGGNALARYISRPVTLADGFDSSNIVVTLDAFKPAGTDIRVYYKVSPVESNDPFSFNVWKRMNLVAPVNNSSNDFDYKEHKYHPVGAFGAFEVPVDNPITTRFNAFAIKIVLVSTTQAHTPLVRDLRAIALQS